MGEQGGPYLTSGLKHSFRKGKGRIGNEEKSLFEVQNELKATLYLQGLSLARDLHLQWPCRKGCSDHCTPLSISGGNLLLGPLDCFLPGVWEAILETTGV